MTDSGILREASEHYWVANDLWTDEDLDPDDHVAVLVRKFCSSDCDDLAYVLHLMTGWATVRATWAIPDRGIGHHTLVREPGGRLLDASGWVDEDTLRRRYLGRRRGIAMNISDGLPISTSIYGDEDLQRVAAVIRALPHAPFAEAWFRELSERSVVDPDLVDDTAGVAP